MKESIIQQHASSNLFRVVVFLICLLTYLKSNAQDIPFDVTTENGGRVLVSHRIQMLGVLYREYAERHRGCVPDRSRTMADSAGYRRAQT